jgi:hypothetical protein
LEDVVSRYAVEFLRYNGDWSDARRGALYPDLVTANAVLADERVNWPRLQYRIRDTLDGEVLAEATLAAAVKVDPPREFPPLQADGTPNARPRTPALPALDVPHLRVLFDQWQRGQGVTLPVDSAERKLVPIQTGHNDYFPAAIAAVAAWSAFNNDKHNPGQPLHWSQHKSSDHPDCIARHTVDMREASDKFVRFVEATARAWRAYGELQMLCQELGAPLAPGARAPEVVK